MAPMTTSKMLVGSVTGVAHSENKVFKLYRSPATPLFRYR